MKKFTFKIEAYWMLSLGLLPFIVFIVLVAIFYLVRGLK